jgi:hypothetical protein
MDGYEPIYLLSEDRESIQQVQNATVQTEVFGIATDHGLFGSGEWWAAIRRGDIPVHTVQGIICALLMESMNDWPTFKILTEDGFVTESITRESFPGRSALYQVGRRVVWRYVETRLKQRIESLGAVQKATLEVWVGESTTLFRPVGPKELQLIIDSGFSHFPPRLPEQPIFYPVCNVHYAREIASTWNVRDSGRGYVTRFDVDTEYLSRYQVRQVGSKDHQEYWIPAEDLPELNKHVIGKIFIVESFPRPE